ncbi:MAG TPA: pentapeptide repeat-containing protein, partial [Methanotrichaceae archaeon]|nr:pentapeptide repeat-containing protein [Methanotrichaceae archaeon]
NSTFNKIADFTGSSFHDTANFAKSFFNDVVDFRSSDLDGKVQFNDAQFNRNANFEDSDFHSYADFKNTRFGEGSSFLGEGANFRDTLDLTGSNINDIYIRWGNIKKIAYDYKIYKILLDNYKKWSLLEDYNDCYFNFRLELQKRQPYGIGMFLDFLQRIFYGYGTKPALPIIWSFIIMMFSALFYYITNGIQKSDNKKTPVIYAPGYHKPYKSLIDKINDILFHKRDISLGEAFLFSATYFTSGASNLISSQFTEFYPIGKSRYVAVLERLFGWVFFAFFLTALGNTIM